VLAIMVHIRNLLRGGTIWASASSYVLGIIVFSFSKFSKSSTISIGGFALLGERALLALVSLLLSLGLVPISLETIQQPLTLKVKY
jgi:hypothetical protein